MQKCIHKVADVKKILVLVKFKQPDCRRSFRIRDLSNSSDYIVRSDSTSI